jgi:hypothetical protein
MKYLTILTLSILILSICIIGCTGQHCIKVGGSYQGVDGNFEYCWNSEKSNELQKPVLTGSDGKNIIGITEEDAAKIIKIAEDSFEAKGATKEVVRKPPFKALIEILKK